MNPVARLRGLRPRHQRLIAGVILAAVVLGVPLLLVGPVVAKHLEYAQHAADIRHRLERTQAALARLPRLEREVAALREEIVASELYLDEASSSVAGARIQELVSGLAEETGATLTSSRVVEPEARGNVTVAGVRLALHGEIGGIAEFVHAVESLAPVLIVRELTLEIDGRRTPRNRPPHRPVIVAARAEVHGIMRSGEE